MNSSDFSKEDRSWGFFAHLSSLIGFFVPLGNIVAPLIIWHIKKDELPFAASQAKECANFQISISIYLLVSVLLAFLLIGFVLIPVLLIANIALTIMAAIKANDGIPYEYPFTIRLIK